MCFAFSTFLFSFICSLCLTFCFNFLLFFLQFYLTIMFIFSYIFVSSFYLFLLFSLVAFPFSPIYLLLSISKSVFFSCGSDDIKPCHSLFLLLFFFVPLSHSFFSFGSLCCTFSFCFSLPFCCCLLCYPVSLSHYLFKFCISFFPLVYFFYYLPRLTVSISHFSYFLHSSSSMFCGCNPFIFFLSFFSFFCLFL